MIKVQENLTSQHPLVQAMTNKKIFGTGLLTLVAFLFFVSIPLSDGQTTALTLKIQNASKQIEQIASIANPSKHMHQIKYNIKQTLKRLSRELKSAKVKQLTNGIMLQTLEFLVIIMELAKNTYLF